MDDERPDEEAPWPRRKWLLAFLGALVGLAIQRLSDFPDGDWGKRLSGAACLFLGIGGLAFALACRRGRIVPALILAGICGLVSGGVFIWNGFPDDGAFFGGWSMVAGFVAAGVFLTLFQASEARDPHRPERWSWSGLSAWKRRALNYADVHETIWTDALLLLGALIFTFTFWLIAHLLAQMFVLVRIDALRQLLDKSWFGAVLAGAGIGGSIGLLRESALVIAALQRVVMTVLRVLAPVLALGLVAFLAALPFTGLESLWATGNTTGLTLGAAVLALILVNAVIGDRPEPEGIPSVLRRSAWALGLTLLPLVLIAAWSTGLRVGQHGLSPDRLWAIAFIAMGLVTALVYARAILRPGDRIGRLHAGNLNLALLLGLVALILSTPLLGFERIATANQLARLAGGKVKPADFDYTALWFDFGPPGRAAIRRLAAQAPDKAVRRYAAALTTLGHRGEAPPVKATGTDAAPLTIVPRAVPLEPALRKRLESFYLCGSTGECLVHYVPGAAYAVVVPMPDCADCGAPDPPRLILRGTGDWGAKSEREPEALSRSNEAVRRAMAEAVRAGRIELRTVERQQLFVDGRPVGETFPPENASTPDARP